MERQQMTKGRQQMKIRQQMKRRQQKERHTQMILQNTWVATSTVPLSEYCSTRHKIATPWHLNYASRDVAIAFTSVHRYCNIIIIIVTINNIIKTFHIVIVIIISAEYVELNMVLQDVIWVQNLWLNDKTPLILYLQKAFINVIFNRSFKADSVFFKP